MKYTIKKNSIKGIKLLFVLMISITCLNFCKAQEMPPIKSKTSFIEWNVGVANLEGSYFPGTSVLYGQTFINENNTIFEYELGLAFPSIVTGKLGIGKKLNEFNFTAGIRPFPFNLYYQATYQTPKQGSWIASLEFNPLNPDQAISFGSRGIFNVGYRWNLRTKK